MEHNVRPENSILREAKQPEDKTGAGLLWSHPDLVTEDPATFLVAHHILVTGTDSVGAIKAYFKRAPEILEIVDEVLAQMEKAELVVVNGDKLQVKQRFIDVGGDIENLRRFLPRLFKIAADRVLVDASTGSHKVKRDAIRYWAIPNDQKSSIEAQAAYLEFKAKMTVLVERIKVEDRNGDSVRLVGAFNCSLSPEDFA